MSTRLKVNLMLIAVFAIIAIPADYYLSRRVTLESNENVAKQAAILMESALAVRSYTVDLIKPELEPMLEQKFLAQTVPAFAATETFTRFRKKFDNFKYKEAVLDPTNRNDLADYQERAIIDRFINEPSLLEATGELFRNRSRYFYVARPIQIKNPACLVCHDTPSRAPRLMRQIYGDQGGFGWKLNQIVGAQIIVVPAFEQDAVAESLVGAVRIIFAALLVALLVTINLLMWPRNS
jgi:two-component system, cell cycle response regulator